MLSLVLRAWLAVYGGHEDARTLVADAIDATKRSGTGWHVDWSVTALGFLETSLGDYEAALSALEPLLSRDSIRCRAPPRFSRRRLCPTRWRR